MIILKRKKGPIEVEEIFYNSDKEIVTKADILLLKQSKYSQKGLEEFITLHIDLKKDLEVIESEFKKNTRYEIRRAENKDNLSVNSIQSNSYSDYDKFILFYDEFAKSKNLKPCNKKLLNRLISKKSLTITYIESEEGLLTVHYYITDGNRARLLYSASQFRKVSDNATRNLIGRANRFLHREDIKIFKESGYNILDLGGVAEDENDKATQQIDSFKKSFGGERVVEYTGKIGKTLLGKIVLGLKL